MSTTSTTDGLSDDARWWDERQKRRRSQDRHSNRDKLDSFGTRPFAGVDGEGGNIDGRHSYLLLRAGKHLLETGKPLNSLECLWFLSELPHDKIWVAYFFDYDVTMMLRDLPPAKLERLLDTDCRRVPGKPCSSFPIDYGDFQIDYMPRKEFKVRRRTGSKIIIDAKTSKHRRINTYTRWTVIHDVGSFFQCSFVKALRTWFSDEPKFTPHIDQIAEGKLRRTEFTVLDEYEREYNQLEILFIARLMEKFREVCNQNNVRPGKWQGPGNIVSAVLKRERVPLNKDTPLWTERPEIMEFCNDAYYGGRFETAVYGLVNQPVYQYDINSAYAAMYGKLPCLIHGEWLPITEMPDDGSLYVGNVRFSHIGQPKWCTLPVRSEKGTLNFPVHGNGTYWSHELEIARQYAEIEFVEGYKYVPRCGCQLFDWVPDMYAERQRIGRGAKGKVLKIVLASTYGKLAQSVGCAPYANPIWAGIIVSGVRAQLISATLSDDQGWNVLMLATDGLFTTSPITSLPLGDQLGEWEETEHPGMFIVQSGIYFIEGQAAKTRGTPFSAITQGEDRFYGAWLRYMEENILKWERPEDVKAPPYVVIKLMNFVGLRLALARNKPELAGQWLSVSKRVSFDWRQKRTLLVEADGTLHKCYVKASLHTWPLEGSTDTINVKYKRRIGGIIHAARMDHGILDEIEALDQPEWGRQFVGGDENDINTDMDRG